MFVDGTLNGKKLGGFVMCGKKKAQAHPHTLTHTDTHTHTHAKTHYMHNQSVLYIEKKKYFHSNHTKIPFDGQQN